MKHLLFLALLLLAVMADAQSPAREQEQAINGTFYYRVDDEALLYVNGVQIESLKYSNSVMEQTKEHTIKAGDRVTLQLRNKGGDKYIRLLFVSSDRSKMLPFTHRYFKCLPDAEATDFSESELRTNQKVAKELRNMTNESFPVKSRADYFWGNADVCSVGGVITLDMIVPAPRK